MTTYTATKYDFTGQYLTGIQGVNTGLVVPWTSTTVPSGFLECNGAAVSRTTYAALFAVIGTNYGVGDGSTTFNVPDLTDKTVTSNSPTKTLATSGGANTVATDGSISGSTDGTALGAPTIASHTHSWTGNTGNQSPGSGYTNLQSPTSTVGGGSPHSHPMSGTYTGSATSVLQPYITLIYIIKT